MMTLVSIILFSFNFPNLHRELLMELLYFNKKNKKILKTSTELTSKRSYDLNGWL